MKEPNGVRRLLVAAAVVALGLPAIAGAAHSGNTEENTVRVYYGDLDLSKDAGIARLYIRLQHAVNSACGPSTASEAGSVKWASQNRRCYNETLSRMVQ